MTADQAFELFGVWKVRFYLDAVVLADRVDQLVGLLRQATRIYGKDAHIGSNTPPPVENRHAVALEAGADGHALLGKRIERPLDHFLGFMVVVLDRQLTVLPMLP